MDSHWSMFWIAGILAAIVVTGKESEDYVYETFRWTPRSNATNVEWEFVIIGKRVTWSVAKVLCSVEDSAEHSHEHPVGPADPVDYVDANASRTDVEKPTHSRLAILEDDEAKEWLARMLSESNYRYDGLWIGGHRTNSSLDWTWIGDDGREEVAIPSTRFIGNYPKWYKSKDHRYTERNCLVFDRIGHDLPTLVPTDCQLRKPFICSRIAKTRNPERIVEGGGVGVDGYRYTIFSVGDGRENTETLDETSGVRKLNGGGVRWRDARLECRKRGQYLATVFSNEAAAAIAGVMLKNRPSMESAWLGGWSTDGADWTWSPTGFKLSSTKSSDSQYPPWLRGHPRLPTSNSDDSYRRAGRCLILDRHLCPDHISPVFLDLDCEKKRPFVCQDGIPKRSGLGSRQMTSARTVQVGKRVLEFSTEQMTWIRGREHCANNHGRIASILDSATLSAVLDKMAELYLDHVWVGGRTEERADGWRWFDETGKLLSRREIGLGSSWCLGDDEGSWPKADPDTCLNLDREGHGLPLFYGLPCDFAKQHVLCSVDRASRSLDGDDSAPSMRMRLDPNSIKLEDDEFSPSGRRSVGATTTELPVGVDGVTTLPEITAENRHRWFEDESAEKVGKIGISQPGNINISAGKSATVDSQASLSELSSALGERIGDLARADGSALLFVLDDGPGVLNAWLAVELKFVAAVLRNLFPLSANHTMGLLTFSKTSRSNLGLNQTDECAVLSHMNNNILGSRRRFNRGPNGHEASRGSNDLIKIADAAAEIVTNSRLRRVAILFVVDGEHRVTMEDTNERLFVADKLKRLRSSGHDVYALFVGQSFKSFAGFADIRRFFGNATNGQRNVYTVPSFAKFSELVTTINSTINSTISRTNISQCEEHWNVTNDAD